MAKKKAPTPPKKPRKMPTGLELYSEAAIEKALRANRGLQYLAADSIGMSCSQMSVRINLSEHLKEVRQELLETRLDVAERSLSEMVERRDLGAICFLLKTRGKSRGYSETQEITVDPNAQIAFTALMAQFSEAQSFRRIVESSSKAE